MSDHLWFIPVSGGWPTQPTGAPPGVYEPREINVQWNTTAFPTDPPAEIPCTRAAPNVMFTPASSGAPGVPAKLNQCYGSWAWRSCTDGQVITVGGQLEVGTVFARELPLDNIANQTFEHWNIVDVWAKYRVSDTAKLSDIFLSINDMGGSSVSTPPFPGVGNLIAVTANNLWRVAYLSNAGWDGWDTPAENLRVVLTFLGTTNVANVGPVTVDVEWFAIRLRDEVNP